MLPNTMRRFGILCVLAYAALSWAVRYDMRFGPQLASLAYPLDTFSMYAAAPGDLVSHVLLRDDGGAVHRVKNFRAFACDAPLEGKEARCAERPGYAYLYEDTSAYIRAHGGAAETPMDLVYRTWRLRPGEVPIIDSDCVIARCRVAP